MLATQAAGETRGKMKTYFVVAKASDLAAFVGGWIQEGAGEEVERPE